MNIDGFVQLWSHHNIFQSIAVNFVPVFSLPANLSVRTETTVKPHLDSVLRNNPLGTEILHIWGKLDLRCQVSGVRSVFSEIWHLKTLPNHFVYNTKCLYPKFGDRFPVVSIHVPEASTTQFPLGIGTGCRWSPTPYGPNQRSGGR